MDWNMLLNVGFQPMEADPEGQGYVPAPLMTEQEKKRQELQDALNKKLAEQKVAQGPTVMMSGPPPNKVDLSPLSMNPVSFVDPELRAMRHDLMPKYKQLTNQALGGIDQQQEYLRNAAQMPTGIDFTPLAALADKWSEKGGNQLTQAAQQLAPMKPEEKMALLAKLQQPIQDDRQKLLGTIGTQLKSADDLRMMDMMMKNQRQDKNMAQQVKMKFNQDIRNDVKNFSEITPSIAAVEAALVPDANGRVNAQRVKMAISNAARLMGEKGVLTDQDILRVQGNSMAQRAAELENFIKGDVNATLPVEAISQIKRAIEEGKAAQQQAVRNKINATRDTYTAMGADPQFVSQVADQIYGGYIGGNSPAPAEDSFAKGAAAELARRRMGK